jgi:hypothetical protein
MPPRRRRKTKKKQQQSSVSSSVSIRPRNRTRNRTRTKLTDVNMRLEKNMSTYLESLNISIPDRNKVLNFLGTYGPILVFTLAQTLAELQLSWDEYITMYPGYMSALNTDPHKNKSYDKRIYNTSHTIGPSNVAKFTHEQLFAKKNISKAIP